MARREYTQTVKPVSRIAEKIFGWLAWIGLLIFTGAFLFFVLVTLNDQAFMDEFTAQFEESLEMQGVDPATINDMTQGMLGFLNLSWMFALYLAIPLILGLFGLLTMKRRILAGFLMLLAGIFSAPLVIGVITGLIPLFFIIAAILLFVRKDEVILNDELDSIDRGGVRDRDYDPNAGPVSRGRDLDRDRDFERNQELEREREYERNRRDSDVRDRGSSGMTAPMDDDVRTDRNYREDGRRNNNRRNDDIEETRQFNKIDENQYRDSDQRDNFVDGNIDSSDSVEPVTDEEYRRTHGIEVDDERGSGFGRDGGRNRGRSVDGVRDARDDFDREGKRYGYENDATTERRKNVDRRNNDDL